jgi:hypothetical protein
VLDRLGAGARRPWPLAVLAFAALAVISSAFAFGALPRQGSRAALAALAPGGRIEVRRVWETKGAPRMEFTIIAGMAELGDGTVWVSDGMTSRILALDARGATVRVAARRGDGPGEVGAPELMAPRPGGGVAVYDGGRNGLELFGPNGRFERHVQLERDVYNAKGLAVLPSGGFAISGGTPRSPHAIHLYSSRGKLVRSWYPVPTSRNDHESLLIAGGPLAVRGGDLLFSQAAPHRIVRYALDGSGGDQLAADPALLKPIADDFTRISGKWVQPRWWFPQSKGIFPLRGGRFLNVVTNAEEGYSVWEVYDARGRRLAKKREETAYEPYAMTRNGDVLAAYRDPETDEYLAARLRVELP